MVSRIFVPLFIALVLILAAGCGSSPEAAPEEDAPEQAPAEDTAAEEPAEEVAEATLPPTEVPTEASVGTPLILFTANRGEPGLMNVYSLDSVSGEIQQLTEGFSLAIAPTWSPDRTQIAFSTDDSGSWRVMLMDADGSNVREVTDFSSAIPDWFPSGDRLIFNSDSRAEPADTPDLYAMNLDGSDLVEVIDLDAVADFDGHVSPDGRRIVFVSRRTDSEEIYIADIDGANVIQLTDHETSNYAPAWAPNSLKILFVSQRNGSADLFVVNLDGTGLTQLTDLPGGEFDGVWSPDGEQIAFVSTQEGIPDLWIMDTDGSNMRPLTEDDFAILMPSWN